MPRLRPTTNNEEGQQWRPVVAVLKYSNCHVCGCGDDHCPDESDRKPVSAGTTAHKGPTGNTNAMGAPNE